MQTSVDEKYLHSEITSKILQSFYTVYNQFRFGFPKAVYVNSMLIELNKLGLNCECRKVVKVFYDQQEVGECETEIIVDNCVAINIETKEQIAIDDELKIYYLLRVSELEVGLFLNFGKVPYHKRKHFPAEAKLKLK